ncbi:WD40-repeat-containing domain protein [Trichoderma chlorosporum]
MATRPSSRDEFEVALICALPLEYNAVSLLFDEFWDENGDQYGKAIGDPNTYTTGRFGNFDVVLVLLPNTGNVSAASATASLRSSYSGLRLVILTGTCGGVPFSGMGDEILLGDVVISRTVIQYDYGRQYPDDFKTRDTTEDILGRPNKDIRGLVAILETELAQVRLQKRAVAFLKHIQDLPPKGNRRPADIYKYPGACSDRLFEADYHHKHHVSPRCICAKCHECEDAVCEESRDSACDVVGCDDQHIIKRKRLETSQQQGLCEESQTPSVFIGRFGSSDRVLKSGKHRDEIAKHYGVIAFETEAAGVWDELPCIIVKGICNYADGHGNKHWQDFAAATAASVAKALMERYTKTDKTFRTQIEQQMKELMENKESNKCLQDLRQTDPRDDKTRIQRTKGHLLKDSYRWILDHADFKKWWYSSQYGLLWIKGDPGKGKTMLLCGIIDEIEESTTTQCLSYFFCQATELELSNATAVLRGLIYMIVAQRPALISHVRKKYDHSGKKLFEDGNSWEALSKILSAMLDDPSLTDAILIIDALDECVEGLSHLLEFINQTSSSSRAKWIVSSRNWPIIEESLKDAMHGVRLCLELNESLVSAAVQSFIRYKVQDLTNTKSYDKNMQIKIEQYLMSNAHGTFLWVALVCQELADPRVRTRHTLQKLESYPSGLDPLYKRMMQNIQDSLDAEICRQILAITSVVYRPITLPELSCLMESHNDNNYDELKEIIGFCGSFLTIREETIYFIHQSAKDFLLEKAPDQILDLGIEHQHHTIFSRSLDQLSKILHRDIYSLRLPGFSIENVSSPDPDPLASIRYSCIYWVDHLFASEYTREPGHGKMSRSEDMINTFFERKYLYWLEALSLLRSMSEGVLAMQKLEKCQMPQLTELLEDANQFIRSHRKVIESTPLQVYASALVFSPSHKPKWILTKPIMEKRWHAYLQYTLEINSEVVAFSHDSALVALGSGDHSIQLWRTSAGDCVRELEGHDYDIMSIAFSHDSKLIVSGSKDKTIRLWCTSTGNCLRVLMGHKYSIKSVAFSQDSAFIASSSEDEITRLWSTSTGDCIRNLKTYDVVEAFAFSPDSALVASCSHRGIIQLWRTTTDECTPAPTRPHELIKYDHGVQSAAFSHDSAPIVLADAGTCLWDVNTANHLRIATSSLLVGAAFSHDAKLIAFSTYDDIKLQILHTVTGKCVHELKGHSAKVSAVAFSPDSKLVASGSYDNTIRIWSVDTGNCVQELKGHSSSIRSVIFSHDSKLIASTSGDGTTRLWRVNTNGFQQEDPAVINSRGTDFDFSNDSTLVASVSEEIISLWCPLTGRCTQELKGHEDEIASIAFSHDTALIASFSNDGSARLWRTDTGDCVQKLRQRLDKSREWSPSSVVFSHDSTIIATGPQYENIQLWSVAYGNLLFELPGAYPFVFSHDSALIASRLKIGRVRLWRTATGDLVQELPSTFADFITSIAFSSDSALLAATAGNELKLWRVASDECIQTLQTPDNSLGLQSVTISHDSALVAALSSDGIIAVWRVDTGDLVQCVELHHDLRWYFGRLSFTKDKLEILTNFCRVAIDGTGGSVGWRPLPARFVGPGMSSDGSWITWNNDNILRLPIEFQKSAYAISGSTVAIRSRTGRVIFIRLSADELPDLYAEDDDSLT